MFTAEIVGIRIRAPGSDTDSTDSEDIAWIVDTWTVQTGEPPSRRQALQLAAWTDAGLDDGSIVDLVRMIRYAGAKRDPWAYVSASMARLGGFTRMLALPPPARIGHAGAVLPIRSTIPALTWPRA